MSRSSLLQATAILLTLSAVNSSKPAHADLVTVSNYGFEDLSGQSVFNEFTFGTPTGWDLYDPNGIVPSAGVFTGTLLPNSTEFFNTTAPEGARVSILFNSSREGDGEYGFEQTLGETLQANMSYTLSVDVGNIASGFATNGAFFNLDEFPGYRIDLLAGGQVIASDNDLLNIAEGEFETSTIQFDTMANHALLGQNLGIRLVNLNNIPIGFTQATSPDLEVDFDNVRLDASSLAVPEPSSFVVMLCSLVGIGMRRRRI
ncbi:MAG: PEP-CTERM sorting domain-containing protein [Planctomycetota bacterium]|nr:PEP-CTERM sorting domain-containing protein [Planctomycetota bacterium]